jgi:hypothetical protein
VLKAKQRTAEDKNIAKTAVSNQFVDGSADIWFDWNVATKNMNIPAPIKWVWMLTVNGYMVSEDDALGMTQGFALVSLWRSTMPFSQRYHPAKESPNLTSEY